MGCAITRIVKFLRRGEKGNSLITAVTELRRYTQAQWQAYGKVGTEINWTGINNASDMKIGDTIVINGVVTDKENISVSLYGTIVAINGTSVKERATVLIMSGERGIQGIQGLQGPRGLQGIPGTPGGDGTNGSTSYFHIKYSSVASPTSASQMTETPSTYIGTYVDFTADDSNDPKKYTWHRFEGMQGPRGIPGVGTNGKTTYLHIKYSNDGGKTFTANSGETPGAYIGVCTDFTENDPTSVSSYTWSKIKGEPGSPGSPGSPGEKGDRGPALRGPQDFSSLPTNYQFYQGADSDPYVDIVYYNGNYYKCVWTHKKGSDDISVSSGLSAKYWVLSDKVEMIATKILLASYALIKNLGVEAIEMKDGSDNIVFRAKDGKVICKSGTFENVTVTGNITAKALRLHVSSSNSKIDGAVTCGEWNDPIVLPELSDGECMNLKIYAPYGTRSSPDASVKPENSKVKIWVHGSNEIALSEEIGLGKGLFDAVGVGVGSYTTWAIR